MLAQLLHARPRRHSLGSLAGAALVATSTGRVALSARYLQCLSSQTGMAATAGRSRISYYGSCDDRFGGRIGNRPTIDHISKEEMQPLPGTGVHRVTVISVPRQTLREWATDANWREATRIHKEAYFGPKESLEQEQVLQRIRDHYVSGKGSSEAVDVGRLEAGLFRLVDKEEFQKLLPTTQFTRIPAIVYGVFDEAKDPCVVDFANKRLGGGWLGCGMAQEEKMFMERFDYGALCARGLTVLKETGDPEKELLDSPYAMQEDEAWILRGGLRFAKVPWYGRTPTDALEILELCNPGEDVGKAPTVLAIDAIEADFTNYEPEHLQMMLTKAYIGFVAAKYDELLGGNCCITSGSWGCGAFKNNERVMFAIQALAANLAGVELKHHSLGDGYDLAPALQLLESGLRQKLTVAQILEQLGERCKSDPLWRSKR